MWQFTHSLRKMEEIRREMEAKPSPRIAKRIGFFYRKLEFQHFILWKGFEDSRVQAEITS